MTLRRASRRAVLAGLLATPALAQEGRRLRDATGRETLLPARIARVFPAGPPASILLWSVAPDRLAGWPGRAPGPAERAFLPPAAADLPELPRLTGRDAEAGIAALRRDRPDLVLDYGATGPAYVALAERVRAETGLPTLLLDGSLARIPQTYRLLGEAFDRQATAAAAAAMAERVLAGAEACAARLRVTGRPRVLHLRGPQGMEAAMPGSGSAEVFEAVGAETVATEAQAGPDRALAWDPDWVIAGDPAFLDVARADPAWRRLRAVREGRLVVAPALPFGWLDLPPSVNRLLGLAWLPALFGQAPAAGFAGELGALYGMLFHRPLPEAGAAALLRHALPRG